jgi:uncharacterized protein (TIGR00730 family)
MLSKVCIFCASSSQVDEKYLKAARTTGKILAKQGIKVVYGGGSIGLMGALASSVLENKGEIIGIIPKFMMQLEWGNTDITEMIIVESMAERKNKFIDNVDAVIAMPGGTGTLEELTETISLKKLGLFTKPIIILNIEGFYNHLLLFFDQMIRDNFIRVEHKQLFSVAAFPEEIIDLIDKAIIWDESAIKLAAL